MPDRRLVAGTVLLATSLATPIAVLAAAAFRITTDPSEPRVGEATTIVVSTLVYVDPPAIPIEPLPLDEFLWTFVAESPKGERHEIALTRVAESTNQWSGRFVFDEIGGWEVGLDRPHLGTPVDPSLGARKSVSVRSPYDGIGPLLGLAIVTILAAIMAGLAARRLRSQRTALG